MSGDHSSFIRLQTQSHISASQWKQWSDALGLETLEVEDIWDEIGYPIFTATRQLPPISFILQLRAERRQADLFDFKDETASLLTFLNLLGQLQDDKLGGGKTIAILFRFFRIKVSSQAGEHRADDLVEEFVVDLCKLILVTRAIGKETITLTEVLNLVIRRQMPVDKVVELGMQALGSRPYAHIFRRCLEGPPTAKEMAEWDEDDDFEEEDDDDSYEGEEGEDDDDDEEGDEEEQTPYRPPSPLDRFVRDFRKSLEAFYAVQTGSEDGDEASKASNLLDVRLEALRAFNPLYAVIPSPDEAEEIAAKRGQSIDPNRIIKRGAPLRLAPSSSKRSRPTSPSSADGGGTTSSTGATESDSTTEAGTEGATKKRKKVRSIDDVRGDPIALTTDGDAASTAAGESQPAVAAQSLDPAAQAAGAGDEAGDKADGDSAPAPAEDEIVGLAPVSSADFSQKVYQLGQLLGAAERDDEAVWQIFLDPGRELEERQALAAALATAEGPANQAYRLVKGAAQFIGLKRLLRLGELPQRNRRFTALISGFVNIVQATRKNFQPNDRQLEGLDLILDHAATALLRLENLRINQFYVKEHPNHYTQEAVTAYRDQTLAAVQALVDGEFLELTRTRAEDDTAAMVELFSTEHYTTELVASCRAYAEELQRGGHTTSLEKLAAAFGETPVEFEIAEPAEPEPGPLPEDQLMDDELGPIFQRACNYLCEQAWGVLWERHEPAKVIPQVVAVARASLSSCFVLKPERRRHATRPRMPITVVSLEKLTAKADVRHLYLRVDSDGKVLYVEGYEDGTYADLMELREYTQMRMQTSNEGEEGSDPLQTGEKYLFTLGRTQDFFGGKASAILASCVRDEEGEIKIFSVFRSQVGH